MATRRNTNHLAAGVLLLSFSLILSTLASALLYSPDNHLIACGASSAASAPDDGRVFLPDDPARSSPLIRSYGRRISLSNPSPDASPLHRSARVFDCPSFYEFQIKVTGTHLIRLHFYPFATQGYDLSAARFHVLASGFTLLSDFSTSSPLLKEYLVNLDKGKFALSFAPAESYSFAFVNAIEVVSVPKDLILDAARLVKPDEITKFDGLSKQALETLYRINVGGPKVTPFNDTLWRTWVPDGEFLKLDSTSEIVKFSGRIAYQRFGASREVAPDKVYNSARAMNSAGVSGTNYSMTWEFPVRWGYKYLVRMHFCDIASLALNQLYFNIYINGFLAYEDFDLSGFGAQMLASPYYVDFVVDGDALELLIITIGPSKLSNPSWIRGLLNGLEIMKMNNTMGNLDGNSPVILAFGDPVRRGLGAFLRSIGCSFAFVSLLVVAFVLSLSWRAESRSPMAWSPLPVDGQLAKGSVALPGKLVDF